MSRAYNWAEDHISKLEKRIEALEPERKEPATPLSPIPRAKGKQVKGGWRLDFDWVDKLCREVEKATGYPVTHECTEEIVVRMEALLLASNSRKIES